MDVHENTYYPVSGEPMEAGSLQLPKAVELVQVLQRPGASGARLVSCLRFHDYEIIVVDIEPEVPQHPKHDIHPVERIAIFFTAADAEHQLVQALRQEFPLVPHLHFGEEGMPRSLCLYQMSYADLKPTWTAAALLRQLQYWLSQTARGQLHAADQPLEQAFYAPATRLVLPASFYTPTAPDPHEPLSVRYRSTVLGKEILLASAAAEGQPAQLVSFVYTAPPQVHGVIQLQPRTVEALQTYLPAADTQFTEALRQHLSTLQEAPDFDSTRHLLLLVRLPKRRTADARVEDVEVWTFVSEGTLADLGVDLGLWATHDGTLAHLVPVDRTRTGQQSLLSLISPVRAMTREWVAAYNGLQPTMTRYVAVGAGSLGSQVVNNLVRAGQGNWVWLDEDQYLPHNAARHYLPGNFIGLGKAQAMVSLLKHTYEQADLQAIAADVLRPATPLVQDAYAAAEVLLDMSASIAVARHLTLGVDSSARRLSLFLNPTGTDVVLLAEPQDRSLRLDQLEMAYYRALIRQPALQQHLLPHGQTIRYSHACRDVSVQLPQEQVALHAAIGARAVRSAVAEPGARMKIWHAHPDLTVSGYELEVPAFSEVAAGSWTVVLPHSVVQDLRAQRQQRLPNETGGVLVGVFDTQYRRVYIVDYIPSPVDSQEQPTGYERGLAGVKQELNRIRACTGGQVVYVGEWHSHPDGYSTRPSTDDEDQFAWLQHEREADGLPAVMAIVGDRGASGWYVSDLATGVGMHHLVE